MGEDKLKTMQNFDNPICPLPIIRDAKTLDVKSSVCFICGVETLVHRTLRINAPY